MANETKNLNRIETGRWHIAAAILGVILFASTGCSLNERLASRSNLAFQELISQRHADSHSVAKATNLQRYLPQENDSELSSQRTIASKAMISSSDTVRAQSPDVTYNQNQAQRIPAQSGGGSVQQTAYQYPEGSAQGAVTPVFGLPSENIGSPNELNPLVQPGTNGGNAMPVGSDFFNYADLDVFVSETQTGSVNIGGAYNSDNGIVGQFVVDERNFDITAFPRSFRDFFDGTAFRGGGQAFRLELVPGRQVQRYLVSFSDPYLLGTNYSFSMSAYLFDRRYFDWDEQRVGGRVSFGRRLTPDLSINFGLRLENVELSDPRSTASPQLNENLGDSDLYLFNVGLVRDTRDHPFLATEGSFLSATYTQGFGDFDYPRGDLEYRRYRLMYERPDGSGRHTVSFGTKLGFSGSQTPIYENYFAGGFSTLRGYEFRGAAPSENGVRVGGEFQWLNTLEYVFPITPDDMVKGVAFCDFGTVEENIEINSENFRVAPGVGLRIHMPALGIGAPLAFDFAFPVNSAENDDERTFSFYLGIKN